MKGKGEGGRHDDDDGSVLGTHKVGCDDDDDDGGVMDVTGEPSSDPMENKLMAPTSGQQLLSR